MQPPRQEVLDGLSREPIVITGGGGSIGSALALRLGALGSQKLVLLEASESNLYALERDWAAALETNPRSASPMTPILGSAGDMALLQEVFATHRPRIVFHAAAFKHVPLMEEHPLAAIANNVFATEILTQVAEAHGARVILLSTDKAVEPASVMGATKRVAEQIVLASGGTVLRLGNVLASRDSVTEVFARQIAQGGPVTVTDPAARRYFLTLDEAVSLQRTSSIYVFGNGQGKSTHEAVGRRYGPDLWGIVKRRLRRRESNLFALRWQICARLQLPTERRLGR